GFAVALTGFGLAALAPDLIGRPRPEATVATGAARFGFVAAPLVASLAALAVLDTDLAGAVRAEAAATVAAVQGNVPRLGLDFNAQRRAVLDNHVRRTEQLAADVAAGRAPRPDLVIWPENSADIDPLRNPDARAAVDRAVAAIGAPVLVGAVLTPPQGPPTNTMIVWEPGRGPGQTHDKRRLQPFGEYVPYREFFARFSPLVERSSQFAPGHGTGVVDLAGIRVAVATCYEVIFDDLVRESVRGGGEVIAVPANNATFGLTEMSAQQIAIDRVRAVEHGRAVIVAATSGVSAVIAPNGQVVARSGQFTADALTAPVVLRSDTTPATRLGGAPETVLAGVGAAGLVGAAVRAGARTRTRRTGKQRPAESRPGPG
ncbi:apolipoprotein N-acyltransferase, partial [Pseudonocardia sp. KRD291]|uniref:apolipoprotein N-acyltransferase n=1 Tax=Pseudonocardia sp. KRD291 TaxID=2792007 RepID=UPI001C4A5892